MKWYKMYVGSIKDIKFRKLKKKYSNAFPLYWTLWCLILDEAATSGGTIKFEDTDDLEVMFDTITELEDTISISIMLNNLEEVGLIECGDGYILVTNWEKYQSYNEASTKRVQEYREKKKNADKIDKVILMFNEITGSKYSIKTTATRNMINARLDDGYTVEQLRSVILHKHKAWGNDHKMKEFVRPNTLFRPSNFENYINQVPEYIAGAQDANLIKVRDMYGATAFVTQEQLDNAEKGFYTEIK